MPIKPRTADSLTGIGEVHGALQTHRHPSAFPCRIPEGQAKCGQRFATVEPVFGNLRHSKQLNRFTLRGQEKVDAQWKVYCLVHNIEKLAHTIFREPWLAESRSPLVGHHGYAQ